MKCITKLFGPPHIKVKLCLWCGLEEKLANIHITFNILAVCEATSGPNKHCAPFSLPKITVYAGFIQDKKSYGV